MATISATRDQFIEELWLPVSREAGSLFFPRLKKNKKMKLFTLTDGIQFKEIKRFEEEKLIQRGDAVLWVSDMFKKVRAESESVGIVFDGPICDEPVCESSCPLQSHFPASILNLDFSSQDLTLDVERVKLEFRTVEQFLQLQSKKGCVRFVLVYTTLLDSNAIDRDAMKRTSDTIRINAWNGLELGTFSDRISDKAEKELFIQEMLKQMCSKYGYIVVKFVGLTKGMPGIADEIHSAVGICSTKT